MSKQRTYIISAIEKYFLGPEKNGLDTVLTVPPFNSSE